MHYRGSDPVTTTPAKPLIRLAGSDGGFSYFLKGQYAMKLGIAVGGPRDGVRLTASDSWHGRIQLPKVKPDAIKEFYPGRYRWDEKASTWVWVAEQPPPVGRVPRPSGHSRKPLD